MNAVFDGIGGDNLWRSCEALREGGRVVVYGFQAKLCGGRMASDAPSGRHPIRESAILGWYILRNWLENYSEPRQFYLNWQKKRRRHM